VWLQKEDEKSRLLLTDDYQGRSTSLSIALQQVYTGGLRQGTVRPPDDVRMLTLFVAHMQLLTFI